MDIEHGTSKHHVHVLSLFRVIHVGTGGKQTWESDAELGSWLSRSHARDG